MPFFKFEFNNSDILWLTKEPRIFFSIAKEMMETTQIYPRA